MSLSLFEQAYRQGVKEILDLIDQEIIDVENFDGMLPLMEMFKDDEEFVGFGKAQYSIIANYINKKLPRPETETGLHWLYVSDESYLRLMGKTQVYTKLYVDAQTEDEDEQ